MKNLAYTAVALTLIGVCATFLAVAGQAHAQSAGAGAVAGSNAVSGSRSASVAASQGGSVNIAAAPSRTTETNTVTYRGSYDVRNVPAVAAPGIITAFNCAHGVSVGGSWLGGGGAFGGTYTDKNCERLAEAAAVQAVAGNRAAVIHLARDPDMCQTFRSAGILPASQPCTNDERKQVKQTATASASTKQPRALYRKCVKTGNKVVFRKAPGVSSSTAKQACLASLGM